MKTALVIDYLVHWLTEYCDSAGMNGLSFDMPAPHTDILRARRPVFARMLQSPEDSMAWYGLGNCYAGLDKPDEALEAYREVLAVLKGAIELGDAARRLLGTPVEPVFRRTSGFDTRPAPVGARA